MILYGVVNDRGKFECVLFERKVEAELWASRGWRRIYNTTHKVSPNTLNTSSHDEPIEMKVVPIKTEVEP